MAIKTGRLGWVGLAVEVTNGAPVTPAHYIPYLECSMQEKIDVLADVSARGTRDEQPENSQLGRQWGEGSLRVNLDATLAPVLFYGALGSLSTASEGNGVYTHTFSRLNTNAPKSLSLTFNRAGQDQLIFPYSVINSLELSFDEGMAEISANVMSRFPATNSSGTLSTTSGFYYAFRHATIQVGSSIVNAANSASPLKVRSFNMSINNNSELQFVAGNRNADAIIYKNFGVSGSFRLAFEDTTQRDNFYALTKQAMIVTFAGNGIGNSMSEFVKLRFYKIRVADHPVTVPNDDYVSEEIQFIGEYSSGDSASLDVQVRNRTSSY